jgi:LuxR family maltose regulon positive regulatory protein
VPSPLLTTKLHIPPARPVLVPRLHLLARLDEGLARPLILVTAPAGFGKTTLVGTWARACKLPVAWLALEPADNDPARFLAYTVAALQAIDARIGRSVSDLLTPQPQAPELEPAFALLVNDLAALPGDAVLVLDDYHVIEAPGIHRALAFLLEHLPSQAHLAIASRADPPLPLARLRGRGLLTELHAADLRFTQAEAAEFLSHVMGLELSADDAAALTERTEGWATGLQMAAVSLQGRDNPTAFVQEFAGSNRYVLDYLLEEVLERQPPATQEFLLRTSLLQRLTGPLCAEMLDVGRDPHPECPDSACSTALLALLERDNLFIVPLDDRREWYRYHRLFADLLQKRLQVTAPALMPALHRRASAWFEHHEMPDAAIDHALAAQDFERAVGLIEGVAEAAFMRGEAATVRRWLDGIPDEFVRARPALCVLRAGALLVAGGPLQDIEAHLPKPDELAGELAGKSAAVNSLLASVNGDIARAAELARLALAQLPQGDSFWHQLTAWTLSRIRIAGGDRAGGLQALDEVARASRAGGNVLVAVATLCQVAEQRARRGELYAARAIYAQALELAHDPFGGPIPMATRPLLGLAEMSYQWNDLDAASGDLSRAIALAGQWREVAGMFCYVLLARVRQAQKDPAAAREAIRHAQQLALKFDWSEIDDIYVVLETARLQIRQGDLGAAERSAEWLTAPPVARTLSPEGREFVAAHFRKYIDLLLAWLRVAQDRPAEALAPLDTLAAEMEASGRVDLLSEAEVLRALAWHALGDAEMALAALEHALAVTAAGGHIRVFLDAGPQIGGLLLRIDSLHNPRLVAHRERLRILLDALSGASETLARTAVPAGTGPAGAQPEALRRTALPEPLSAREVEVLQLLARGLSTPEIARELVVAPSTVRSHLKSIYGKLGVGRRWAAVARAQELRLL